MAARCTSSRSAGKGSILGAIYVVGPLGCGCDRGSAGSTTSRSSSTSSAPPGWSRFLDRRVLGNRGLRDHFLGGRRARPRTFGTPCTGPAHPGVSPPHAGVRQLPGGRRDGRAARPEPRGRCWGSTIGVLYARAHLAAIAGPSCSRSVSGSACCRSSSRRARRKGPGSS